MAEIYTKYEKDAFFSHTWSMAIRTGTSLTRDNSFLKRTTTPTAACVWVSPVWTRSYSIEPSGIAIESTPFIHPTPAPSPNGIGSKIWHGNCCNRDSLYFKKSWKVKKKNDTNDGKKPKSVFQTQNRNTMEIIKILPICQRPRGGENVLNKFINAPHPSKA